MSTLRAALILATTMWSAAVVHISAVSECPTLKPSAHVDPKFIFLKQPDGGFHCTIGSGFNSMPSYTPKPMSRGKANKKLCAVGRVQFGGATAMSLPGPHLDCQYGSISEFYCTPKAGSSTSGLSAAGLQVPKAYRYTIVDTDNHSYMALGQCYDGALYTWAILTTDPNDTRIRASTMHALRINEAIVKESQEKRIKWGRFVMQQGECTGGGSALGAVGNGLGGIIGRK